VTAPVDPVEEGAHPPGPEPLWSESWYFDFVDEAAGIGGWIRLGLMPNQDVAWINALVCGPAMPTVALVDFHAPLPADPGEVVSGAIEMRHGAAEALRDYRVAVRGPASSYDDPAGLLVAGARGRPAELELDLHWRTEGVPFGYQVTPRYEIPCAVTGSVVAAGATFDLAAAPGQRDHSYGVRDWWSMDWVWSAIHLDDGTHLHGVDLRIPGVEPMSVGYLQRSGEALVPATSVTARSEFADDGLPADATLTFEPGPVSAEIDPRGHAPVRLVAPDGRVSLFPRAWAAVATADGRRGVGWLEWNRSRLSS
jgi:hypothetical protein